MCSRVDFLLCPSLPPVHFFLLPLFLHSFHPPPSVPPFPLPPSLPPHLFFIQAFSKKCIERRKEWLTQWLQQRRERRDQGLDESLLYSERIDHISYSEFVNKELILFSNMDNERSIACSVDGDVYMYMEIMCIAH